MNLNKIKQLIKITPVYKMLKAHKEKQILETWKKQGKPYPPPHLVKQLVVKDCAQQFEIDTLVETGTYYGDMIWATINIFKTIVSIELDNKLFLENKQKFSPYQHISIMHGDSGKLLKNILNTISSQCIFWLDGHTSPGYNPPDDATSCPIKEELSAIFDHHVKNHIILIDDAQDFNGQHDYPTIEELKTFVINNNPKSTFINKDNIIRIYNK